MMIRNNILKLLTLLCTLAISATACNATGGTLPKGGTQSPAGYDVEMVMSLALPKTLRNERVDHKAFTVYFNTHRRIPNCVVYQLTAQHVLQSSAPDAERRSNYKFYADPDLSTSPNWWEYKRSGYDRGHMVPAADMKWDATAMQECFYMSNICPQDGSLNSGAWHKLEGRVRTWAERFGSVVVFTGPIVKNVYASIGPKTDIAVPDAFYKIVVAPQQRRAIAFIYENKPARGGLKAHAVSIDHVEELTGIDFMSELPVQEQSKLESDVDTDSWLKR